MRRLGFAEDTEGDLRRGRCREQVRHGALAHVSLVTEVDDKQDDRVVVGLE
jgi:hypothetical protein